MRPGMTMGGMGPGPATIMSGPNTMVRSVGGGMVPGGMNMIRQPGMIQQGQPRMMQAGVRMPIRVSLEYLTVSMKCHLIILSLCRLLEWARPILTRGWRCPAII